MAVELASQRDLECILAWLEREYQEDGGEGFWNNRRIITRAFEHRSLYVIRLAGESVAFQVGIYAPDILNVRKDHQGLGLGAELFKAALERADRDNINLLEVECSPRSSYPFWQRMGFKRCGDLSEWGDITVRRILERRYDLPNEAPRCLVRVAFLSEDALYREAEVEPLAVFDVEGARLGDGKIMLNRRVVGISSDADRDLVVKIEVDGQQLCFCKAKHDEASALGVEQNRYDGTFYLDRLHRQ